MFQISHILRKFQGSIGSRVSYGPEGLKRPSLKGFKIEIVQYNIVFVMNQSTGKDPFYKAQNH